MISFRGAHLKELGSIYGSGVAGVPNSGGGIAWIFLDRFLTDRAAGAVNGTAAEPGGTEPCDRTVTDTGNVATITGGEYRVSAITGVRDPWLRYVCGITRAAGVMLRADASADNIAADNWLVGLANTLAAPGVAETLGVVFGAATIKAGIDNTQIAAYVAGTDTSVYTVLRTTGGFILAATNLLKIIRSDATVTLYPHVTGLVADAAVDCRVDDLGVVQLPITDPTLYPIPTVSDSFSDTVPPLVTDGLGHLEANGDGAGVTWQGDGTFTNLGNKAYVDADAALGAELLVDGDMEAATAAAWTPGNNATLSKQAGTRTGGSGIKVLRIARNALNNPYTSQAIQTIGQRYRITGWARSDGNATPRLLGGAFWVGTTAVAWQPFDVVFLATGADAILRSSTSTGTEYTEWDDVSIKQFIFAELLRAVADNGQPYAAVAMTITADTQAGVMINLDSVTNPQNGIRVWYDRIDSKIYAQELIAGVWQADSLAGVAAVYGAGDILEVRRIGNSVYVFYGGAYVGNFVASSSNANTLTALFATDNASYFEDFGSFPATGYDYGVYA